MKLTPIIKKGVRVLRPSECKDLVAAIPKMEMKTIFRCLLFTGMRYVELKRFQKHPSWFDGNFINLPKDAVHKHKRVQLERSIRLNPIGRMAVEHFIQVKRPIPSYQSWSSNLACWSYHANLTNSEKLNKKIQNSHKTLYRCPHMSVKTTRKSWESWLVFYYPERLTEITLSQGHNVITAVQHYLNMPFTEHDKIDMKEFVDGWI